MSFAKLGSQHTVNTTIAGDQDRSAVIQLLNGDIVVAWTDTYGAAINVRGQILDADGVTRDGSEFMLNTTLSGDLVRRGADRARQRRLCGRLDEQRRLAIQSHTSVPRALEDGGYQNHAVTQVFGSDGGQGRRRGGLFSRLYSTTSSTNPMPSAGHRSQIYLQGSVALTANLASNSDDFDVLFTFENVH